MALVPWLAVSSALPPEHIHEPHDADHHASVAHRHFEMHDHDGAQVEPGEGPVVWIDESCLVEARASLEPGLVIAPWHLAIAPALIVRGAAVPDEATLPHGPPRASASLRAPPSAFPLI